MTTSLDVSPGQRTPAPVARRTWWRSRLDTATTPARLRLLLVVLVLLSLAWGVLAALTADQHASAAADVVAAGAEDAGALDELDELLLHPAMRAPPTARTARTERDERWNISATSMGAELSVASHENLVLP